MLTDKNTNDIINEMQEFETYDTDKAWNSLKNRMSQSDAKVKMLRARIIFAAASIVLFIGIFAGMFYLKTDKSIYENTTNMPLAVVLPDSSKVYLNVDSKIVLDKNFGKTERRLSLTGIAFFEVTHNKQKPFIINVKNSFVEVTGTSFCINAKSDVEVFVKTGSVKVYNKNKQVSVNAGCAAKILQNNSISVGDNTDVNYLSWKTKKLIFDATPVKKVIADLASTYNCNIVVADSSINNLLLTATFDKISIDEALAGICMALNLHFDKEDNIYILHN